jgi:hypothetical protein
MRDISQRLLQGMRIDALDRAPMLACQLFNLPHARIISPIGKANRHNALGMPFQQHPHRMNAVNRLRTFQEPSTRHVFDEV